MRISQFSSFAFCIRWEIEIESTLFCSRACGIFQFLPLHYVCSYDEDQLRGKSTRSTKTSHFRMNTLKAFPCSLKYPVCTEGRLVDGGERMKHVGEWRWFEMIWYVPCYFLYCVRAALCCAVILKFSTMSWDPTHNLLKLARSEKVIQERIKLSIFNYRDYFLNSIFNYIIRQKLYIFNFINSPWKVAHWKIKYILSRWLGKVQRGKENNRVTPQSW